MKKMFQKIELFSEVLNVRVKKVINFDIIFFIPTPQNVKFLSARKKLLNFKDFWSTPLS